MIRPPAAPLRIALSLSLASVLCFSSIQRAKPTAALASAAPTSERSTLRVGMWTLWHDRSLLLKSVGANHKISLRTCAQCTALSFPEEVELHATGNAVEFTRNEKTGNAIQVSMTGPVTLSAHNETITLPYPITISARAGILVITVTLPIENYVERVVLSEGGSADTQQSLQALAIVVRTFALHEPHGHKDYDLCDSTHCQLLHWGGNSRRQSAVHAATLSTAGESLWFHGAPALSYFNKDCGGHTASPIEIWPRARSAPYLPSQADRFCTASDARTWASDMSRAELSAALATAGLAPPGWQHLAIEHRGPSGRAITLRLDTASISAQLFQLSVGKALGWSRIPSTWFEVNQQGDRFFFHGRGFGHGVGLCQKGAAAMATQGRSAQQILQQYFPGTQTSDEATGRAWQSFSGSGFTLESLDSTDSTFMPQLSRARAEASQRSGLNLSAPIIVRAFSSTPAFRNTTQSPGWVAAFSEGSWIATQPLRTLAGRGLLDNTLLHEFLHALVEHEASPQTPLWLREGLVESWSQDENHSANPTPAISLDAANKALAHPNTEAESESAHRAAGYYAQRLIDRNGRTKVIEWLRSGLPASVLNTLSQR